MPVVLRSGGMLTVTAPAQSVHRALTISYR
jgi:hypothetical protein